MIFVDEEKASGLEKELLGKTIRIRYMPTDPSISYLDDRYEPRFGWRGASQNPRWLSQAPAFDLADTMRK